MFQSPSLRGSGRFSAPTSARRASTSCFNPLHCGAVVASGGAIRLQFSPAPFQSPSLRGSGRFGGSSPPTRRRSCRFQSPSLRGSGRFPWSTSSSGSPPRWFQSPSLRGSGRFERRPPPGAQRRSFVSIPFIAGQWSLQGGGEPFACPPRLFQSPSLRGSGRFSPSPEPRSRRPSSFNPLHCGAVVASLAPNGLEKWEIICLNPLHCGAVVASWEDVVAWAAAFYGFQSPSLRGSGRFCRTAYRDGQVVGRVSIPFIAGQWSLLVSIMPTTLGSVLVSIPFIAGQWSLRLGTSSIRSPLRRRFNPLHCGAVVASGRRARQLARGQSQFQSPSLRGSGRFTLGSVLVLTLCFFVSIPFIAGQWSLQVFPPLPSWLPALVSIPFIAGQWSLPPMRRSTSSTTSSDTFQSPSLRGSGRFLTVGFTSLKRRKFQSPSLRGSGRFT